MLSQITEFYDFIMSKGDPRVADWPLMGSPFGIWAIIAAYVYTVKVLGPRLMKDRKPFRIERLIVAYNILMVIASAGFFYVGGQMTYLPPNGKFSLVCQRVDYSNTPEGMQIAHLGFWLLWLKIFEFADTIFFVLRKKNSHISALHVIHHSLVPWGFWMGLRFGAGGHNAFFPLINLFVHTIMYSYYCLAALGPKVRKYLWWKRYLTMLQLAQFAAATIHAFLPLVKPCGFQPFFAYAILFHSILFWFMFMNFYKKSYRNELKDGETKALKAQ